MYASKSFRGFYDPEIHFPMPEDAVELPDGLHAALLQGETDGKKINFDAVPPTLIDRPPPSPEVLAGIERLWRDERLLATDGVVSRHRDEVEGGGVTTLPPERYSELQQYRQALRNWPEAGEFPLLDHRPPPPLWLVDQLK